MGVCAAYKQGPENDDIYTDDFREREPDSEIGAITKSITKYEQVCNLDMNIFIFLLLIIVDLIIIC